MRRKSGRASADQLETRAGNSSIEAGRVSPRPKSVDTSIQGQNKPGPDWWQAKEPNSSQGKDLLAAYNACAKGGNLPRLIVTRDGEYVLDENGKDYTFHGF